MSALQAVSLLLRYIEKDAPVQLHAIFMSNPIVLTRSPRGTSWPH